MKTILVPLDGSALAERVLSYVALLGRTLSARVHLLLVTTEEQKQHLIASYTAAPPSARGLYETDWQWKRRAQSELAGAAEAYLAEQAQALRAEGPDVTYEVTTGAAAECIADIAASEPQALIAMATHGYSGLRRWTLGSVADKVVQTATTPIFLVRATEQPPSEWSLRRIVVPLDGSALAEQPLPLAIELASQAKAELILLQVITPLVEYVPGLSPFNRPLPSSIRFPDLLREQAQQQLTEIIGRFGTGEVAMMPVMVFGDPAEGIVDETARRQADLIVMATHGYSGLRRWALGSVAYKVLHASTTPLLLLRAQPQERELISEADPAITANA
jgi:nucleotide-binding universal stress UspA family protein